MRYKVTMLVEVDIWINASSKDMARTIANPPPETRMVKIKNISECPSLTIQPDRADKRFIQDLTDRYDREAEEEFSNVERDWGTYMLDSSGNCYIITSAERYLVESREIPKIPVEETQEGEWFYMASRDGRHYYCDSRGDTEGL